MAPRCRALPRAGRRCDAEAAALAAAPGAGRHPTRSSRKFTGGRLCVDAIIRRSAVVSATRVPTRGSARGAPRWCGGTKHHPCLSGRASSIDLLHCCLRSSGPRHHQGAMTLTAIAASTAAVDHWRARARSDTAPQPSDAIVTGIGTVRRRSGADRACSAVAPGALPGGGGMPRACCSGRSLQTGTRARSWSRREAAPPQRLAALSRRRRCWLQAARGPRGATDLAGRLLALDVTCVARSGQRADRRLRPGRLGDRVAAFVAPTLAGGATRSRSAAPASFSARPAD